jgi:hypothetical protein
MDLVSDNLRMARALFRRLAPQLEAAHLWGRQYWDVVGKLQLLANLGLPEAQILLRRVDFRKAPEGFGEQTRFRQIREGPPGTSFKGARRQLQADPTSPNKTFGMRPHGRRDSMPDER